MVLAAALGRRTYRFADRRVDASHPDFVSYLFTVVYEQCYPCDNMNHRQDGKRSRSVEDPPASNGSDAPAYTGGSRPGSPSGRSGVPEGAKKETRWDLPRGLDPEDDPADYPSW